MPTANPFAEAKAARPWFRKKRWWLAIGVVVLLGAGAIGGGTATDTTTASDAVSEDAQPETTVSSESSSAEAKPKSTAKPTTKAKPKPARALRVEAATLVKDFDDNELAADAKYKGKKLRITGVVSAIDTELFDDKKYILRIGGGGEFEILTVNCNDMSTKELATLGTGKPVTVVGQFDDGGDLGVEVKDCALA